MRDQQEINTAVDQAWPFAPFDAWDLIAQERVTVIGWYDSQHYELASGLVAHLSTITTNIPQWLIDAEQAVADAQDERATLADALDAGGAMMKPDTLANDPEYQNWVTTHAMRHLSGEDFDNLILNESEAPRCPRCQKPNDGTIGVRRNNSAYVDDVKNWSIWCRSCYDDREEILAGDWEEWRYAVGM